LMDKIYLFMLEFMLRYSYSHVHPVQQMVKVYEQVILEIISLSTVVVFVLHCYFSNF